MSITAIHVIITGKVQGVGYRNWTLTKATQLGIDGWVRNREDGTVEALFSGEAALVQQMIKACYDGPISANITSIAQQIVEITVEKGFRIR